jgi:hypothetical protein
MKRTIVVGIIVLLFLFFATRTAVGSPLDLIFEPMRHIDLEDFYNNYHEMIDLVIYFAVFTGTSQAVFKKRFPGNPGKAISVALGFSLSISMVIAEHYTGFNLKALGTIAATILILILAAMIYYLLKNFGTGSTTAATTTIIITYISIRTTTPQTYNWLQAQQIAPWTDLILIIALIIGFIKILTTITHRDIPIQKIKQGFLNKNPNPKPLPISEKEAQNLKDEKWVIKKKLRKNTKKGQKDEQKATKTLSDILGLLNTPNLSPESRKRIAQDIREISERESDLQKRLNQIRSMDQRLQNFDIQEFQNLKKQFDQLDSEGRKKLWELIQEEREKIGTEQKIQELQQKINQWDQQFRGHLNQAINQLNQNKNLQAAQWITQAIRTEREADPLWRDLKGLENALLSITKKELKELKRPK